MEKDITLSELFKSAEGMVDETLSNSKIFLHSGLILNGEIDTSQPELQYTLNYNGDIEVRFQETDDLIIVSFFSRKNDVVYINSLQKKLNKYAKQCNDYEAGKTAKIPYIGFTVHPTKYNGQYSIGLLMPLMWHVAPTYRDSYYTDKKTGKIFHPKDSLVVYFPKEKVKIIEDSTLNIEQAFFYAERQAQADAEREAAAELARIEDEEYREQRERDMEELRRGNML